MLSFFNMSREEMEKMQIKPWEWGFEMMKQERKIESYRTVSVGDEDHLGNRQIEMVVVPTTTVEFLKIDGFIIEP